MEPHRSTLRSTLDLATTMIWRELVLRYKRSVLGIAWALVDPAFQVLVYFAVFGVLLEAGRGMDGYALFTAMGVLPWLFFSTTAEQGSSTLLDHAPLIRKIAFRHELLILAVVVSRLTTLVIGVVVTLLIATALDAAGLATPRWQATPLILLGTALLLSLSTGVVLLLSGLQVVLGDVVFLVRFALRIGFYACPIVYPLTRVPEAFRPLYELNPLVAMIWCFQAFTSGEVPAPSAAAWASAIICALGGLAVGLVSFRRLRGVVAELV